MAPANSGQNKPVKASDAVNDRVITPASESAFASLTRLMHLDSYMHPLSVRLAMTMMICNKMGALAGIGGTTGERLMPVSERYRLMDAPAPVPTMNLGYDMTYLASESSLGRSVGSYDDSSVGEVFRSANFIAGPQRRTRAFYKKMRGQPLAPDGVRSRVIANYTVETQVGVGTAKCSGAWQNVASLSNLSSTPNYFLEAAFKKRDMRGPTEWDRQQIRRQIRYWVSETVENTP